MKLMIAVPAYDTMRHEFVKSLTALVKRLTLDGVNFDVDICSGTLAHVARDRLAAAAIGGGYDWVLWLDSDMVFDEELLYDLQFAHKDFVTGICRSRRYPFCSCVFSCLDPLERVELIPRDTFKIAGCGFACVLMKTEILATVRKAFKSCFLPTVELGEDLAFCLRAHAVGYQMFAEPGVQLGHVGNITIYPHDAEQLSKINLMER